MRKLFMGLAAAAMMSVVCSASVFAGEWKNDGGHYWYQKDDGSYYSGGMFNIDGTNFCFDSSGYMLTGWQQPVKFGAWYYFEDAGNQAVGWKQIGGKWYYLDPAANGAMKTGWFQDETGNLYYFEIPGGAMKQNEMFVATNKDGGEEKNLYEAQASGILMRNTKSKTSSGTEMEYMDDGAIRYRTSIGALSDANDSGWHWAHRIEDIQDWKAIDHENVTDAVNELKNELVDKYESVIDTKSTARKREKIKAWEERAKKAFEPYVEQGYMTSSDVALFVSRVINDTYDLYMDDSYDEDEE